MKVGIYVMHDSNLMVRCVDGVFACIARPADNGACSYYNAVMSAPAIHTHQDEIRTRLQHEGVLLTTSRAAAQIMYGVPDDVELYVQGDFGVC